MIVLVAMSVVVPVIVIMLVIMPVVMAAAAGTAMAMIMFGVIMVVMRRVVMGFVPMACVLMRLVIVIMMMAMVVIGMVAGGMIVIGALLRAEGAHDRFGCATLTTHHLGQHMVVSDINGVCRNLGWGVAVADMPGDGHQPQRVFSRDFQQLFGRGLDDHEPPVLQLHCISVIHFRGLVEVQQEIKPTIALQGHAATVAILMVQRDAVDDLVSLHSRFADNGCCAQHGGAPEVGSQQYLGFLVAEAKA